MSAIGAGAPPSAQIHAQIQINGGDQSANMMQNVQNALTGMVASAQSILQNLSGPGPAGAANASSAASAPGAFSAPGIDSGAWAAKFDQMSQVGSMLDKMEQEATRLMQSPNKADQIKGQQMMAAMQQIMEAIIKAIQSSASAAQHAIDGSQAH